MALSRNVIVKLELSFCHCTEMFRCYSLSCVSEKEEFHYMKKQIVTLTAIAALSVGAATTASADSTYTVKSGDTLWGISQANNVSVSELKGWNDLSSDLIFPKQQLSIGEEKQEAATEKSSYTCLLYTSPSPRD